MPNIRIQRLLYEPMYRVVLLSCALCPPRARAIECDRPVPKNRLLSSDKHPKIGRRMAQSLLSPCAGPQISDGAAFWTILGLPISTGAERFYL